MGTVPEFQERRYCPFLKKKNRSFPFPFPPFLAQDRKKSHVPRYFAIFGKFHKAILPFLKFFAFPFPFLKFQER